MTLTLHFHPWPAIAILAGILILAVPRLANYIIAIFLILWGLFGPAGLIGGLF